MPLEVSTPAAVLFDMDGVLVDSTPIHAEAFRRALATVELDGFEYAPYAGMRTAEVVRAELLRTRGSANDSEVTKLAALKSQIAIEEAERLNPVFPYALDVLERVAAQFPIALVSSGSAASVERFIRTNSLDRLFHTVVHGGDVTQAKPAPDAYLEAARRLAISPRDCLVIEDADNGEAAALAAGCRVRRIPRDSLLADLPEFLGLNRLGRVITHQLFRANGRIHPREWSAIIPAAGRGTRLGSSSPKILFELAGRTILDWLLDFLLPRCSRIVIVASPSGTDEIRRAASARSSSIAIAIQSEPLGMANAVECGLPLIETENVLTIWGDQAAVRPESLDFSMSLHQRSCALATVPTLWRRDPYIHFDRDAAGSITAVRQSREGDTMPADGESDSGLFLFRTRALARYLKQMRESSTGIGARTREQNLLPILPLMDSLPGNVISARIISDQESMGVNTPADARLLSEILSARTRENA